MSDIGTINKLIASVTSLTSYFSGHRDQIEADRAELRGEVEKFGAEFVPGRQTLIGLLPNQLGIDSNGDGLPDGWHIPANNGVTRWTHVGQTTYGSAENILPGSLEEEFYASIPSARAPSFRNHKIQFWEIDWDKSRAQAPDNLIIQDHSDLPASGQLALFVKEKTPGVLDHITGYSDVARGQNGWAVWGNRGKSATRLTYPGGYRHTRLSLETNALPARGSIIVAARQGIATRVPIADVGWGIFPGLTRRVRGDDYEYEINFVSDQWETKA